ncbi:MAG: trigger factor [Candidatus Margulisbacteria bacterium]|nr:trigger factor [Candidatus Margulisiibacteriota bacterium]
MKINKFDQKGFTITMEIEEDYSTIESFMDESFKEVVQDAVVPGFRKGKVPRNVFEKNYGQGPILEKAVNKAMNKAYLAAIDEKKIFPVDYPRNIEPKKLEEGKPFVFSLEIDVKPEVKLGKYKGLKVEKIEKNIEEKDIEQQLEHLRESYAEYVLVENEPVKTEHIVSYNIKATIDDKILEKWTKSNSGTKVGNKYISEEFDKALEGMKVGETKNFEIDFKEDFFDKEVAGKKVKFEVALNEIRSKKLPELNDELVKKASPFKTVEELKKDLKEKMQKNAEEQVESQFKDELLRELVKSSPLDVPQAMVEREIDRMLQNLEYSIGQSRMKMEDYLKIMGKDIKALREEFKIRAEERVKVDLLLEEIAEKEKVEVSDQDLDAELTRIAQTIKGQAVEESKKKVSEATKDYVKSYLRDEKTIDFLKNHAKISKKS